MADKERKRLLSKEQLRTLIQEENIKTTDDIQRVLKEMFGDVLQEALEAELGHSLGYEKNDAAGKETGNRRNGHSAKTVRSEFGDVELAIPRDRDGEFDPVIVKKHQKNVAGIEDQILSLYARGVSTREIQDHFQQIYGVEVSPALISNVTNKIMPIIKEWQNRPLQNIYAVVFLDAIHFKVKQDGQIVNKAAYMVLGIDLDGQKDVLGIWRTRIRQVLAGRTQRTAQPGRPGYSDHLRG